MHGCSEHRFPGRERQIDIDVPAADAVQRVRLDCDVEVKIAVASALHSLAPFARNAQLLAVGNAFRNAHLDTMGYAACVALVVEFEHAQLELDLGAVKSLREAEAHRGLVIAPRAERGTAACP